MFDFEKLIAYQKAREVNKKIQKLLLDKKIKSFLRDQFYRASISMVINIAEGTGKLFKKDRKNFYVISRGSVFEHR
jgi:four helix bundle protein